MEFGGEVEEGEGDGLMEVLGGGRFLEKGWGGEGGLEREGGKRERKREVDELVASERKG